MTSHEDSGRSLRHKVGAFSGKTIGGRRSSGGRCLNELSGRVLEECQRRLKTDPLAANPSAARG